MVIPTPVVGASLPPTDVMEHDTVRASQHIYRVLLDAISHPGRVWKLIQHPHIAHEAHLPYPWMASVLMTLLDHEVSLHVATAPEIDAMANVIERRTRAPFVAASGADFVAADIAHLEPTLIDTMKTGSFDYPDDGATLILHVESLDSDDGATLTFTGPGINGELSRPAGNLTPELLKARRDAVRYYPLGIDIFIVDQVGHVMSIPRTTTITIQEGNN